MFKDIYHGSKSIIKSPIFGLGKPYNDYGLGFYCTEDIALAKEWAVEADRNGFANHYRLDMADLKVLDLTSPEYGILNWLAILVDNRTFDIRSDFGEEAISYLHDNFLIDYGEYDVIVGYRADDSYFSFAQDFLNNAISLRTLNRAMMLGNLGKQTVLISKGSFDRLEYVDYEEALSEEYYPSKERRDRDARAEYRQIRRRGWQKDDIYMMQIVDRELKPDDLRV